MEYVGSGKWWTLYGDSWWLVEVGLRRSTGLALDM